MLVYFLALFSQHECLNNEYNITLNEKNQDKIDRGV